MDYVRRHMEEQVNNSMGVFRVVVLHGARQTGKTTLLQRAAEDRRGTYVSLDDDEILQAALDDPRTFLTSGRYPLAIDEIQRGGDRVIRAIKLLVDDDPTPGRFLLSGSTNFLTVPTISESLAGRAVILRLCPLSQAELSGAPAMGIHDWYDEKFDLGASSDQPRQAYMELLCRGGYPESVELRQEQRQLWFTSYIDTVAERDIVELGDIRRAGVLPQMLRWAAANTSSELNIADASSQLGVNRATFTSYIDWLSTVFLVERLPSWTRSRTAREVRRPKLALTDTGLAAGLLGINPQALESPTATLTGPLLESFVANEIARQHSAIDAPHVSTCHWRDKDGHEVDLVFERADGAIVAVEVKATSSPTAKHLRHVAWLRDRVDRADPGAFRAGVLLHTGPHTLKLGDRLYIAPINSLWQAR